MDNEKTLHDDLYKLHKELTDKVIKFCKDHHIDNCDTACLWTDSIYNSIEYGEWTPGTDSALTLCDENKKVIIESI